MQMVEYNIDVQTKTVYTNLRGVVTEDELFYHQNTLKQDPLFESHFNQLVNCLELTKFAVNSESLWQLASANLYSTHSQRAFVVTSALHFGMARIFQNLRTASNENIAIFKELSQARQWLGLDL